MEEKETSSRSLSRGSPRSTNSIVKFAQAVVSSKIFDWVITGVILLQVIVLVFEATPELHPSGRRWERGSRNIYPDSEYRYWSFHSRGSIKAYRMLSKAAKLFQEWLELF